MKAEATSGRSALAGGRSPMIGAAAVLALAVLAGAVLWAATAGRAEADPAKMPDIGQAYAWWYSQGGGRGGGGQGGAAFPGGDASRGGERGGGDFHGGGGREGDRDHGGGDSHGGGGRRGGGREGGEGPGFGRPPIRLLLGVSGGAAPAAAPEVFYRLTPDDPDSPVTLRAPKPVLADGIWRLQPAPPEAGTIEVFCRLEVGGRTVYVQTAVRSGGPSSDGDPVDPLAEASLDWPRLAAAADGERAPLSRLPAGGAARLVLAGDAAAPESASAVAEDASGPPEALEFKDGALSWTAPDAGEGRRGRLAVIVVDRGGDRLTYSLTVTRPR